MFMRDTPPFIIHHGIWYIILSKAEDSDGDIAIHLQMQKRQIVNPQYQQYPI